MPNDLDRLQGTWKIASLELEGMKLPALMFPTAKVVVNGATFTSTGMGAVYEGILELDESTSPKSFSLKFTQGPEEGNTNFGIYELDGDADAARWKLCLAMKGEPAPTDFTTSKGSGRAMEVLKR
jgi:uncharacterized protein (TIGR03067 family)